MTLPIMSRRLDKLETATANQDCKVRIIFADEKDPLSAISPPLQHGEDLIRVRFVRGSRASDNAS